MSDPRLRQRVTWLHVHYYRHVEGPGVHSYGECRCGKRRVLRARGPGWQPINRDWLEHRTDDLFRKPGPPLPKACRRRESEAMTGLAPMGAITCRPESVRPPESEDPGP